MVKSGKKRCIKGFTLIEMVTVIIILGIVAVGATSFMQYSTRMYLDAKERDQLISGARFVLERLKREIRHAAPNSLKLETISGNQCLSFYPIVAVAAYIDIPVAPEAARSSVTIKNFDGYDDRFLDATHAVVYGLNASDYDNDSGKKFRIKQSGGINDLNTSLTIWLLSLETESLGLVQFTADSPTRRMYFINTQTTFCFVGTTLTRNGITLADKLAVNINTSMPTSSVEVIETSLQRNGLVRFMLNFVNEANDEPISITSEIQVPNVP